MADKPILLFPKPSKVAYQTSPGGPDRDLKKPTKNFQTVRIGNMLKRVSEAFENQRIEIQQNADNAAPEMVLVFETRGTVLEFFKAVKQIPEFKYLGDFEKEFDATDEFSYTTDKTKPVQGKLFFVLANTAALKQLMSLWSTWKTKKQQFRTGETKWKHLFNLLFDIRIWGVKDMVEETGVLEDLRERISRNEEVIPFEVELWYRKSRLEREGNVNKIKEFITEVEGEFISECIIEEIGYHALLLKAPISIFDNLLENNDIRFFKSSSIMYIRPVGQSIHHIENENAQVENLERDLPAVPELSPPLIALLDGMPMQNHNYLSGRLNIHDPDNFQEDYPANERHHGTAMASLIIHGDLNDNNEPLNSSLLVRPVMRPHQTIDGSKEYIPENFLLTDLIHRSVKEIMEDQELKKSIKIFNISLGDSFRVFDTVLSSWAKLLDWLADKYNILFIVSAGNSTDNIIFENLEESFADTIANPDLLEKATINFCYIKNRFRKIISPAESINSLTVGSSHADACEEVQLNDRINLFANDGFLSPISRMGLGYRKSIKPDILANGGKILYRRRIGQEELICLDKQIVHQPGIKVAAPAGINNVVYSKGTSNSTAIVSHTLGKLHEQFLANEELKQIVDTNYFPVVAKSLIVHSASWNKEVYDFIGNSLDTKENKRDAITRFMGYGQIEPNRIIECTDKRVTLIGFGNLKPENASIYELPLPNALSGTVLWKKLIVTLSWLTPINCDNLIYRTHKLWFDFPNNELDNKLKATRSFYNDDTVRRGTLQHEIFYGDKATAFADNTNLKIKVNCKTDAIKYDTLTSIKKRELKSIKYGLVVTLEVDPNLEVDIYNELLLRLRQPIQI